MTRSVAWLLAAALGLPAAALAQSPYHVRIPGLKIAVKQEKDKDADKEKPKDAPKEKPKDADKEKDAPKEEDKPKDPAPEAPAARPTLYPVNPYPPPAPAVRDPRFMAWQQVLPGPGAPPHVEMGGHGAMPGAHVVGRVPAGEVPVELNAPHAAVPVATPGAVVAPLPLPAAPVSAPAAAPARPARFSVRGRKESAEGERTIDIVRDGRKGWRVTDGPR